MTSKILKPATLVGAVVLGGLALSSSAFAFSPLVQGYALAASTVAGEDKPATEGSCGGDKAHHEGSCGADKDKHEGKCGMRMDTDKDGMVSAAEHAAHASAMFAAADTNKDGMVDAAEMKAAHAEGKCGEGKCGGQRK
jgi:uncharacterized low-complexity protein